MDERLNTAPCGYFTITQNGVIQEVNETFLQMVQYEKEKIIYQHIETLLTAANKFIFHTYFYPYIELYGSVEEMFISLKNKEGQVVPVLLNGRGIERDGIKVIDCVVVSMGKRMSYEREIRQAKKQAEEAYREKEEALLKLEKVHKEIELKQEKLIELNRELEDLATTDKLTGLKKRRYFHMKLEELIIAYEKERIPFSLSILDIDHFKLVNDSYGHQIGDRVLEQVARIGLASIKESDFIFRYGGEEFIILYPCTGEAEAKIEAEKVRRAIEEADWEIGKVTISIGISTSDEGETHSSIVEKADKALYFSKAKGRNRVTHINQMEEDRDVL